MRVMRTRAFQLREEGVGRNRADGPSGGCLPSEEREVGRYKT